MVQEPSLTILQSFLLENLAERGTAQANETKTNGNITNILKTAQHSSTKQSDAVTL